MLAKTGGGAAFWSEFVSDLKTLVIPRGLTALLASSLSSISHGSLQKKVIHKIDRPREAGREN